MYAVSDSQVGRHRTTNLFTTRSNTWHSQKRTLIAPLFKLSHLLDYESLIDSTIASFCAHLDAKFLSPPNENKTCDMSNWLFYFAWDVLAELTLSRPMGFMDSGSDRSGFLDTSEKALDYFAVVSQMPWLDEVLVKNPIMRIGPPAFDFAANFCIRECIARQFGSGRKAREGNDMLDDFLNIKAEEQGSMGESDLLGFLLLNIIAGSDTTATPLRGLYSHYISKTE